MKNIKKFLSVILSLCLMLSACVFFSSAAEEKTTYLLIGDSITEGFGVKNPDEASYGKIVADTNGYEYINDAVVARDSDTLRQYVESSYFMRKDIRNADIISLSIGANDYFANDEVVSLVVGALLGTNNKQLNAIAENYYENLCAIVDEIHVLNPDVVILIQNVYTAWTGFAGKAFKAGAGRVNKMIDKYLAEHPDNGVYLCDITPAITVGSGTIASDCVHPNAKGNIEIAKIVLNKLYEMGLGTQTEPVINAKGIDYNFFEEEYGTSTGMLLTLIVKTVTGNL